MLWMEDPKMPGALTHRLAEQIRRQRLPARTARVRLTALYGGLFLLCGVVLLVILYLLFIQATGNKCPQSGYVRAPGCTSPTPTSSEAGKISAAIIWQQAATARQQAASDRDQLLIQSGITLGVVVVVAVALGWLAAGRVLRPLSTITATARRISASSLRERLNLPGPHDELKDLGDTLDDLFARLETSFEAQRRFVANASHELSCPRSGRDHPGGEDAAGTRHGRPAAGRVSHARPRTERLIHGRRDGVTWPARLRRAC
jgi:signal transduction histidine kinase